MSYPSLEQYNYAMQFPKNALTDSDLKKGTIAKSGLGLPLALCGGFALTYTITVGGGKYAVRCFHKQSNNLEKRYKAISSRLESLRSSYFVKFEFQPQGITVDGQKFPVVKMAWASGKTLGEFMGSNYGNRGYLHELNRSLFSLTTYLEKQRIAHGDIQPGNIMVANEGRTIQLIDYDGMYVEDLKSLGGAELGLLNFQHPGRNRNTWDSNLDRFSFILINFAVRVLEIYPDLWDKTQSDENGILFKAQDFADPTNSDIFQWLTNDMEFKDDARNFAAICKSSIDKIPSPEDFLAKRNIPQVEITISSTGILTQKPYISAFPILDASNYELCLKYVGDQVELIGQIVAIVKGTTQYSRRHYIFINFGENWKGKIVKLNVWPETLETLSVLPDDSWVGRWVSVVGLMEPPYHSDRFGYTHLAISITPSNQLHIVFEDEAEYRLGKRQMPAKASIKKIGNREILERLEESSNPPDALPVSSTRPSPKTQSSTLRPRPQVSKSVPSTLQGYSQANSPNNNSVPITSNQSVLQNMRAARSTSVVTRSPSVNLQKTKPQPTKQQQAKPKQIAPKKKASFFWLIFVIIAIAILYFLPTLNFSSLFSSPLSTSTKRPTVAVTLTKPVQKPTKTPTNALACIPWNEITRDSIKRVRCIYGLVTYSNDFMEDGNFTYTLVRFSDNPKDFYLISHERLLLFVKVGDCVSVESVVSVDANGVFYVEPSKISTNKNLCTK